nr:alpha/beta hydrolase [Mycolicibacterium komanii]CRL75467.1 alpha/beta fold hydrolase [Mycolicibacterium komanii]
MDTFAPLHHRRTVDIPAGTIGVREAGQGEPVLFIHGVVANGVAWRNVVRPLSRRARCIAPDWPLGSHQPALPSADLTLPGLARMVVDVLDALGLDEAVVVGNGYGGDIAQVVAAEYPHRVKALVLAATNAFDSDPAPTKVLRGLTAVRGAGKLQALAMRSRLMQRQWFTYGGVTKRAIPPDVMQSYLTPLWRDRLVRNDFRRFMAGLSPRYLAEYSPRLADFERPALLVWPTEERFFPAANTRRLAEIMGNARLVTVDDCYSWIPEDQPAVFADLLDDFLSALRPAKRGCTP